MNFPPRKICQCKIKKNTVSKNRIIREYCKKYILSNNDLFKFQQALLTEIKNGLAIETHENADVKCNITYVTHLPDGTERGKFLALDLGGSDFRILLVELFGEKKYEIISKIYNLKSEFSNGEKLFDYIVDCLADFINIYNLEEYNETMGFTFSFPTNQYSLESGVLLRWTKGFNIVGVVGKNVVDMLKQSLKKNKNVKIKSIVLLNDTTGTLMSCALENHNCRIGIIIGNGFNGCYFENIAEVENWDSSKINDTHVIINTEIGAFGENGCIDFIRTEEDKYLDSNSINSGQQIFEKMVSGMYLGELVRIIIIQLIKAQLLFDGHSSDVLEQNNKFKTLYITEIESDFEGVYTNCKRILKELRLEKYATDNDCENIFYICQCISRRSAHLVSAVIATLINKMNEKIVTVGIDGSVYRYHPHYNKLLVEKIGELIYRGITFDLTLSVDGAGKGAAIIAAVAASVKS